MKKIFENELYLQYPYLHFFNYQVVNGCHSFRYHRKGVQKNICCKSLEKAKIKVLEFCEILNKGKGFVDKKTTSSICEYAKKWLNVIKKPFIHNDTFRVYNGVLKNYIEPYFNNKCFGDVAFFDLQEFFNNLPSDKGKTIENIHIVLNGVYDSAYCEGIIEKNIMERVKVKKHIRKNGKCLSRMAEKDFVKKIKGNPRELSYLVMLYGGLRPCEISSVEFDWSSNTMTIKNGKLKSYQNNFFRTIPIPPKLKELKSRLETEDWKKNTKTMSARFPKICPEYRLYDLRHTFVTRAKQCGVSDEVVNFWTGHTIGKSVTANVYTHYDMEHQQKEMLKVDYKLEEK